MKVWGVLFKFPKYESSSFFFIIFSFFFFKLIILRCNIFYFPSYFSLVLSDISQYLYRQLVAFSMVVTGATFFWVMLSRHLMWLYYLSILFSIPFMTDFLASISLYILFFHVMLYRYPANNSSFKYLSVINLLFISHISKSLSCFI